MKNSIAKIKPVYLLLSFFMTLVLISSCHAVDNSSSSQGNGSSSGISQDTLQGLGNLGLGGLGGDSSNSNTQDWLNSYIQQKNDQQNQQKDQEEQLAQQQSEQLNQLQTTLGQISGVVKKIAIINLVTILLAWVVLTLGAAALIKYLRPSFKGIRARNDNQ